jgi:hypothetical protein
VATKAQRQHLHALMKFLIAKEPQVHYQEFRPMRTIKLSEQQLDQLLEHGGSVTMDCSEAVTCLCKWAGLQDPNGLHYDGDGYTGTLLAHLPHYSNPSNAMTGAIVVFGPATGEHACMVIDPGDDPVLFSHGTERGPIAIKLSEEKKFHHAPVTFLSIAQL